MQNHDMKAELARAEHWNCASSSPAKCKYMVYYICRCHRSAQRSGPARDGQRPLVNHTLAVVVCAPPAQRHRVVCVTRECPRKWRPTVRASEPQSPDVSDAYEHGNPGERVRNGGSLHQSATQRIETRQSSEAHWGTVVWKLVTDRSWNLLASQT